MLDSSIESKYIDLICRVLMTHIELSIIHACMGSIRYIAS